MTSEFGTVVLVSFPFADSQRGKRRPAMILADAGDGDVLLARITTRQGSGPEDVMLSDWEEAGLLLPSCVKLHKLATLHSGLLVRAIGELSPNDSRKVLEALVGLWKNLAR